MAIILRWLTHLPTELSRQTTAERGVLRFLGKWLALSTIVGLLHGWFMKAGKGPPVRDDKRR